MVKGTMTGLIRFLGITAHGGRYPVRDSKQSADDFCGSLSGDCRLCRRRIVTQAAGLTLMAVLLCCASCSRPERAASREVNRCPVCGMDVDLYPNFLCQIRMKNGSVWSFDGPKDMFRYYQNPGRYHPSAKQSDVASVTVSDYYSLAKIDAFKARFVAGSNVIGPMGKELIPFETETDAQDFMVDHSGTLLLKFEEVTSRLLKDLN